MNITSDSGWLTENGPGKTVDITENDLEDLFAHGFLVLSDKAMEIIKGLHHIAIISSSEKSVEFYTSLGFSEFFRKNREYDTIVLLEGYGVQIEMFIDSSHPKRLTDLEQIGLRHLALKVDSREEMSKQFKCGPIKQDWLGINFCYTEDPDGLPIEFHE